MNFFFEFLYERIDLTDFYLFIYLFINFFVYIYRGHGPKEDKTMLKKKYPACHQPESYREDNRREKKKKKKKKNRLGFSVHIKAILTLAVLKEFKS